MVIEADCDDDADTLKFLSDQWFKQIFAFEPDPIAFEQARSILGSSYYRVTLKKVF